MLRNGSPPYVLAIPGCEDPDPLPHFLIRTGIVQAQTFVVMFMWIRKSGKLIRMPEKGIFPGNGYHPVRLQHLIETGCRHIQTRQLQPTENRTFDPVIAILSSIKEFADVRLHEAGLPQVEGMDGVLRQMQQFAGTDQPFCERLPEGT